MLLGLQLIFFCACPSVDWGGAEREKERQREAKKEIETETETKRERRC